MQGRNGMGVPPMPGGNGRAPISSGMRTAEFCNTWTREYKYDNASK